VKNRTAKGTRKEKLCSDELNEKGYITWKTIRVRYQNIDLFGLFDVLAIHPEKDHLLFIQVKSNRVDNKMRDAIRAFKMPECCRKEIWIWKDNKGWIKEYYT
jgi:Holliday junction resolvase-like predicted endonuclease